MTDSLIVAIVDVLEEAGVPPESYTLQDVVDVEALEQLRHSTNGDFSISLVVEGVKLQIDDKKVRVQNPGVLSDGSDDAATRAVTDAISGCHELLACESDQAAYEWAIEFLQSKIPARMFKVAIPEGDFLVPTVSTHGGRVGQENAIPIDLSIPGSVYRSGTSHLAPDLQNVRGDETAGCASERSTIDHRSLVCAPIGDIGVIVGFDRDPGAFSSDDLALVEATGRLVAAMMPFGEFSVDSA